MKEVTSARGQNTQMGGSDPTLCGFQPPNISWDRSRPLAQFARSRFGRVHESKHKFRNASSTTNFNRKGASYMALLKAPSKQPKTTNLQVRLEEEVRRNLDRYAEFLQANPSYVVSEALKFLFRKDDEFKRWTEAHPDTTNNNHNSVQGDALKKTA